MPAWVPNGGTGSSGPTFYNTGQGAPSAMGGVYHPPVGGSGDGGPPDNDSQPGVISVNPLDPVGTVQQNMDPISSLISGLKDGILGTSQPDAAGQHGGLIGGVPIVSDVLRAGAETVANVAGPVIGGTAALVGGTLERLPTGIGSNQQLDEQFADPEFQAWLDEVDPATGKPRREKWAGQDKGLLGTGILSNEQHFKSVALREFAQDQAFERPTFNPGAFTAPGSMSDTVQNFFDIASVSAMAAERLASGVQNIQGRDRLAQAQALVEGAGKVAINGITEATPVEQLAVAKVKSGDWTRDEALDFMSSHGSGWSSDPRVQIAGSIFGDPLNIATFGAGAIAKVGAKGAQLAARSSRAASLLTDARASLEAAQAAKIGLKGKALKAATAEVERLSADVTVAEKAVADFTKFTATKTPSRINFLARGAEGSEKVAATMKLAGKAYDGLQGTAIGRGAKIVRTIVDPMHAMDLSLPGSKRAVDLMSDVIQKNVVETLGANHHLGLLEDLTALDEGVGAIRDQFSRDLAVASSNHARAGLMDLFRKAQIRAGLGEDLMAGGKQPTDLIADVAAVTREKDLLKFMREEVTKKVLIRNWDEAAKTTLARQLEATYGLRSADEWMKYFEKASVEKLSYLKHAAYGSANRTLLEGVSASIGHPSAAQFDLNRLVLIAKGTLTRQGAEGLLAQLAKLKTNKAKLKLIREWQERYPSLRYVTIEEANLGKGVQSFEKELADDLDRLPMQVMRDELDTLHDDLKTLSDRLGDGYQMGFRPEERFLWGLKRENGTGLYKPDYEVWADHVADGGMGYRPGHAMRLNIVGHPIVDAPLKGAAKAVDVMEVAARMMKAQVTGAQISEVARQRFVTSANQNLGAHGVTEQVANSWWGRIQDYVMDHPGYSGPRGFGEGDLYGALQSGKLIPQPLLNGSTRLQPHDVMRLIMEAYDGDIRYIGLTQKLTGKAKRLLYETTGSNFAGQISEHAWPLLKFRYNPVFQMQEKFEPWVLNSQRGIRAARGATLSQADMATERMLAKVTDNSLIRQADLDQAEFAENNMIGAGIDRTAAIPGGRLNRLKTLGQSLTEVKGMKRVNMLRTLRAGMGKELRANWDAVRPGTYDDMKELADIRAGRVLDEDEFAISLLGENAFANDLIVDRLGKVATKFGDNRNAWKTGAWHTPSNLGELQALDLEHIASAVHLTGKNGKEITNLTELRGAFADGSVQIDEVSDFLRRMNADPDYIRRVENGLSFSWGGFWKTAEDRFSLTPQESSALQDMMAGAAALRDMTPVEFMSQVFSPGILDGTEGLLGHIETSANLLRETRSQLAGKVGTSTREDLIGQLSQVFSSHLDPSAKKALLMEFRPELRKAVTSGTVRFDLKELDAMWKDIGESELASRIVGYMDGKVGTGAHELIDDEARGVKSIRDGAISYMEKRGVTPHTERRNYHSDDDLYEQTAKAYSALPETPFEKSGRVPKFNQVHAATIDLKPMPAGVDQRTYDAYSDFVADTRAQWDHMTAPKSKGGMGIKVVVSKTDPYTPDAAGRATMQADLAKGRLKVLGAESDHPLMTNEQNVMFRAVHDVFGHAAEGFEFGPRGELNAAIKHAQMYSDTGRAAMLTETHGQTSWVNFSDDIIEDTGPVPLGDDPIADYATRYPPVLDDDAYTLEVRSENFMGDPVDIQLTVPDSVGPGMSNLEDVDARAILQHAADLQEQFPDYRLQHIDAFEGFEDPAEGLGLGMDRRTFAVTIGGEGTEPVIFLNPRYFDEAEGAGWDDPFKQWVAGMKADQFEPGVARTTPKGTPYNVATGAKHVMEHEYGHVVLGRIRFGFGSRRFPENKLVNDVIDEFLASPEYKLVSEYGTTGGDEAEVLSDLFSVMMSEPEELQFYGVDLGVAAWGDKLRKALTDSGHMKPLRTGGTGGKTVREVNAAKRGSIYAPQKAALLPQDLLDRFGEQFVGRGRHVESNPDVARTAQMFGKWTDKVIANGLLKGERSVHAGLLNDIAGIPTKDAAPYNLTEGLFQHLATQSIVRSFDDAFRLQYFKQSRSMLERSINHPVFGLYPASYMWGKIAPEIIRFLAAEPFGMKTGGLAYSAMDAQAAIAMQREYNPAFDAMIEKLGHSQALSFAGYMMPTIPWDISASAPAWAKDIAGQGIANEQAVAEGGEVTPFNALKPVVDTVKKLNPLEMSIPWATRAAGEVFGSDKQDLTPIGGDVTEPTQGAELGTPLARVMQELQEALRK